MKKGTLLVVVVAACVVATALPAMARTIVVDRVRVDGDFPVATAIGDVNEPAKLWVQARTRPTGEHVVVSWVMTCVRGSETRSRDGVFSGPTPIRQSARMPFANPDTCSVEATVELHGNGVLVVTILARV